MGKILNLSNQKFGKLTALYPLEERNSSGNIIWHCICECGNTRDVVGSHLKNGTITSCGCFHKKYKIKEHEDLTNQKFGKLTILYQAESHIQPSGQVKIMWHCKCECGNECDVRSDALKSGHTQSCGCIQSKGELKIGQLLKEKNIQFEQQKTFKNCRFQDTNYPAYFDFYINNQYIIEFDGIQHFKCDKGWNTQENFEIVQKHDKFKNEWCLNNNIPLIRIPYWALENLSINDLSLELSKFLIKGDNKIND